MTMTRALLIALALTLTACSGSGRDDTAPDTTTAETTSTTEGPTESTEWTSAMQNACTAEAETLTRIIKGLDTARGYSLHEIDIPLIEDEGFLQGDLTHWTIKRGELIGIDANEDGRCGGIYLP